MKQPILLLAVTTAMVLSGCGTPTTTPQATGSIPAGGETSAISTSTSLTEIPEPTHEEVEMPFELTSNAFKQGMSIPAKYTCTGQDISPPLAWGDPPQGTRSLALIMDDPDAPIGTWVHWILYNIPAEARSLAESIPADAQLPDGSLHGKNSWNRLAYGGPCPPSGTHRYYFKLYALDTLLNLPGEASKSELLQAMEGHILMQTELMGTYKK